MPFYVGVNKLPRSIETMNLLDFTRDSAWWAFNFVANYANIKYSYMMKDICAKQKELEDAAYKALSDFEQGAKSKCRYDLTTFCNNNTERVIYNL